MFSLSPCILRTTTTLPQQVVLVVVRRSLIPYLMAVENGASSNPPSNTEVDLVGGPFAVVESDPGVFTTLIRKLGIKGIEVEEVYDIQPWGLDHLKPKGLILCFNWKHDKYHPHDFLDPAAKDIWFANQLVDDACASLAILNVLFNCLDVELGDELNGFRRETSDMSPKMKGLAISNSRLLRETQNSLARPSDMWGSISAIAEATHKLHADLNKRPKKKAKGRHGWSTVNQRPVNSKKRKLEETDTETFHFIGYVPAHGKVWELDGLKSGPLEVGELPKPDSTEGWENVVRPALRLKMQKYGAFGGVKAAAENIQFNLLALVQDRYEIKSDELELLKREKIALESRMKETYGETWSQKVDEDLLSGSQDVFTTLAQASEPEKTFAKDFGSRAMEQKLLILNMPTEELVEAWQSCITRAMPIKIAIDEEVQKAISAQTETVKRTHDYTPFIREFLTSLHNEGLHRIYS
ncbi:cysteine proteinase [Fomitiporia mediterranea MF3/22]|uniref:cysteine proteinase n=1 Tax=Fomitiporia mediterranea (strain MF3/22) TaxID=694068 RepID=UPI0004409009|nr:cysteine proteinase [Fomitiporia mediterranea MF3/22]EJD00538.1 cysteine proteinase [Fomitiporia mediterranea MF3/22]